MTVVAKTKKNKTEYQKYLEQVKLGPSSNAFYAFMQGLLSSFKPKVVLSPDAWADQYRYTNKSSLKGKWDSSNTAYIRGPAEDFLNNEIDTVVLMWASQVGKSAFLESIIGSIIHQDPSNIYFVSPEEESNRDFKEEKLEDMFQASPCFYKAGIVKPAAPGKSDTNSRKIRYKGGYMAFATSHSLASLAGRSVRYLFLDEVDRFKQSAKEGDIVGLAKNRTNSFQHSRKIFLTSTPTDKETSRIYKAYLNGDQRKFHIRCPHCDLSQTLVFTSLKWDVERDHGGNVVAEHPNTAWYECEGGCRISTSDKDRAVRNGYWVATAKAKVAGTRSYHLNFLYSPFVSFETAAKEYLEVRDDKDAYKTFVNTKLGEVWEDETEQPDYQRIYNRAEQYTRGVPPKEVGILFATCDVQERGEGRFEIAVWGAGRNKHLWLVDHIVIPGSYKNPDTYKEIEELRYREYVTADGRELTIDTLLIDSSAGNTTPYVYDFCANQPGKWAIPLKGRSGKFAAKLSLSKIEKDSRGKVLKRGLTLVEPNVNYFKFAMYGYLDEKTMPTDPNYIHTAQWAGLDWHKQMVSEKIFTDVKNATKKFIKTGPNEALDLTVYALAYLEYKRISSYSERDWDKVFKKQEVEVLEMEDTEESVTEVVEEEKIEICILRKTQLNGKWVDPGSIHSVDSVVATEFCDCELPFAHRTSERPPDMTILLRKVKEQEEKAARKAKLKSKFFK